MIRPFSNSGSCCGEAFFQSLKELVIAGIALSSCEQFVLPRGLRGSRESTLYSKHGILYDSGPRVDNTLGKTGMQAVGSRWNYLSSSNTCLQNNTQE
ncbi:hypothetical protein TNCV_630231 [Trichonephila clavipes]|nr:hypothetical protein TNCV_630231 [Trichonephila clavipes]